MPRTVAPCDPIDELRDFSRSLPMALLRAREAVMARFRPMLRRHDLTEQQWRVLRALKSSATALKPSEISQLTLLSLPSLSRLLRTLEARDMIRRAAHEEDLRAAQLSLSPRGKKLVQIIAPHSEASYAQIGAAIGPDDLETLYGLLDAVVERLGEPALEASSDA